MFDGGGRNLEDIPTINNFDYNTPSVYIHSRVPMKSNGR